MTTKSRKPYTRVGDEHLTASVFKTGNELIGFDYRFNITRLSIGDGRVTQWFTPEDLFAMTKLIHVLAAELANDGCMETEVRNQLSRLAAALDQTVTETSPVHKRHGETDQ